MFWYFVISIAVMMVLTMLWIENVVKRSNQLTTDCVTGFTFIFLILVIFDIGTALLLAFHG